MSDQHMDPDHDLSNQLDIYLTQADRYAHRLSDTFGRFRIHSDRLYYLFPNAGNKTQEELVESIQIKSPISCDCPIISVNHKIIPLISVAQLLHILKDTPIHQSIYSKICLHRDQIEKWTESIRRII